jgi:DNA polymerase I
MSLPRNSFKVAPASATKSKAATLRHYKSPSYIWIDDGQTLATYLKQIKDAQIIGLDCETSGLDPHSDYIRLIQIAVPDYPVLLIDLPAIPISDRTPLKRLLNGAALKLGHNLKFEWQFLTQAGLELSEPLFDTQLAYRTWTAGLKLSLSLQSLARKLLNVKLDKQLQRSDFSGELSPKQLRYAAIDAAILLDLYPILSNKLKRSKLLQVAQLEFQCIPATAQMELNGMLMDLSLWQTYGASLERQRDDALAQVKQLRIAGKTQLSLLPELTDTINPNSHQQLLPALRAIGAPIKSTSQKDLVPLAKQFPVIQALLDYRKLSKITSTFNTSLPAHVHPITGRLHANWYQYGARSGRFSCKNPPLQTIPRHKAARQCFVAPKGHQIIKADFSQIELRIVAKLSGDTRLNRAYRLGEDIHRLTASLVTGKPVESITEEDRRLAKAINFGLIYGMGAAKLQTYAEMKYGVIMTLEEASLFSKRFFAAYPGVKRWHDLIRRTVYSRGIQESRTLFGRRRRWKNNPRLSELFNHPVQGLNADMTKMALVGLVRALANTGASLIGMLHDEILLECPTGEVDRVSQLLQSCMVNAAQRFLDPIPVVINICVSSSWGGDGAA